MNPIKSYVPILRWRSAELSAVEKLYIENREKVTPLIEFIMPPPKLDTDYKKVLADSKSIFLEKLPGMARQILKAWGNGAIFIDVHLLDGDIRPQALGQILSTTKGLDIFSVPVVHIIPVMSTDADKATRSMAANFANSSGNGLCIRIDDSHFKDENIGQHIKDFVAENKLKVENTDILVDLKVVDGRHSAKTVLEWLSLIPFMDKWRSIIMAGGAFPRDLSEYQKHEHHQIDRQDWNLWKEVTADKTLKRKPIFSDYTIQHPIFYGHMPGANPSASIRYTNDERWEVLRGAGLRNQNGGGHKQYPKQAQLLVGQSFFKGAKYSFGDSYIAERADPKNQKNGNPMTWLIAGINHHLTLVTNQISKSS